MARGDEEEGWARRRIMVLERLVQAGEGQPLAEVALHTVLMLGKNGPTLTRHLSVAGWAAGRRNGLDVNTVWSQRGGAESLQSTVPRGRFC